MIYDAIIIGAGPAGLSAARQLRHTKTLVLEKMDQPGKKLLISGAGQCNLTHGGPMAAYKDHYGSRWRFVKDALMAYTNEAYMRDLAKEGLTFVTMDNGKVFPKSLDSQDVVQAMLNGIKPLKVYCKQGVVNISKSDYWQVQTDKATYQSHHLIVACGGHSYPKTGSTGDSYQWLKPLGLEGVALKYGLSPVYIKDFPWSALQGLSFKNVNLDLYQGKKKGTYAGDLLITHFGLSGPLIINNSRYFSPGDEIRINFLPAYQAESLDQVLLKLIESSPKKLVVSLLQELALPNRLLPYLCQKAGIDKETRASDLAKKARKALVKEIVSASFEIDKVGKSHIAMVTTGGLATHEVNKKTFEVRQHPGLYFVGECLDVDGDTGGYNIQFAVSSGYLAGQDVLKNLDKARN